MLSQPQGYQVPNLKGKLYEDVIQDSVHAGTTLPWSRGRSDEDTPRPGPYLDQVPGGGQQRQRRQDGDHRHRQRGPQVKSMPNLSNMEYRQAYIELDRDGHQDKRHHRHL
ncbi:MAG: hypothetical protein V8S34_08090 [Lawsonibacter sp.]